jgi:hypothetical protein
MNNSAVNRPSFEAAVGAWKALLQQRALPTDLLWVFDENLCFEPDPASQGGFRLSFQTRFTPPPADAECVAYDYFHEFEQPLVFYRLGTCRGKSVCVLLCDEWFRGPIQTAPYIRRDDWLVAFQPGTEAPIEEVTDEPRWTGRLLRGRPLHELDFCMNLRAVHELKAHGRLLTTYERYGLKLLHVWRRLLGQPE